MKLEIDLNENEYIKLNNELEELYSKYQEINIQCQELNSIVKNKNSELNSINDSIRKKNKKEKEMLDNTKINPKTICTITINGTILTIIIFTGLGIKFDDQLFALYGLTFYIGETLAITKIMQKVEEKKINKLVNSNEYLEKTKEIELLKKLVKVKEEELSIIKSKKEEKEEELNIIKEEIENKNNELLYFNNKIYIEIDNILDTSLEEYNSKKKIKTIDKNK